jgi:peptidoglycan hydrolase CwlO-like protein
MWEALFVAAATIVTGVLTWITAHRSQRNHVETHTVDHELDRARRVDEATRNLLDGYKDMVDNLQEEVVRLTGVIEDLRVEQEECERRNDEMASLILDLQRRLANLESRGDGP